MLNLLRVPLHTHRYPSPALCLGAGPCVQVAFAGWRHQQEAKGEWGGGVSSLSPPLGQRFSEFPCRGHSSHWVPSTTQDVCLDSGVCFRSLLLRFRRVRASSLFSGWPCLHSVNGPWWNTPPLPYQSSSGVLPAEWVKEWHGWQWQNLGVKANRSQLSLTFSLIF